MALSNHEDATEIQAPIGPVFMQCNIPVLHYCQWVPPRHPFCESST